MPLTPVTWLDEFTVNLTTTGTQSRPRITHLANGNILVVWDSTDNTGVGAPLGIDVIGQLFNPLGEPIGTEFLVNHDFFADDEGNADVAALASGGFVTVFDDFDGSTRSIRLTQRDADGLNPVTITIANDTTANADPTFFDPRVAVSSDTSVLVVYQATEVGGNSRIVGHIYNSTMGTLGAEISIINFVGTNNTPAVTVLENGNYVIAADTTETGGNSVISYRIVSATGSNVLGATRVSDTNGNSLPELLPSVTALTGGGFVITWGERKVGPGETLKAQIFEADGDAVGTAITIISHDDTVQDFDPDVVGLADGGFLVFWHNDVTTDARGQRYDAGGSPVGSQLFLSDIGFPPNIDAELLADGRVAVTFIRDNEEIGMKILDTRDFANNPGVYSPQDWQIGTIGADTITSDGDVFFVAGWDGDDTINTDGAACKYMGGNGADRINVIGSFDADIWEGGAGTDTINFTGSFTAGGIFDLAANTATPVAGNIGTLIMTGFERLIGTIGNDEIFGTTGINVLVGGNGEDHVDGRGGIDTINGGAGDDLLIGGTGADTLDGDGDNDYLAGGIGDDLLIGDLGNDTLNGGLNTDTMLGGSGNDTYYVDVATDKVFETTTTTGIINAGGLDTVRSGVAFNLDLNAGVRFVENLTLTGIAAIAGIGNALNNVLAGNNGANFLNGKGGNDTLNGGLGSDTMLGGSGNDTYVVNAFGDQVFETTTTTSVINATGIDTVQSAVTFNLNATAGVRFVERLTLTGTGAISGTGNGLANVLVGNGAANTLNGLTGNDTLTGGAGFDSFIFNSALLAANVDRITDFFAPQDTIRLENAFFTGLAGGTLALGGFVANATGLASAASHRIIYETDTGRLFFDSNGVGGAAGIHFATLNTGLSLTRADFFAF